MANYILGVDVASFQGHPNWKACHKAGYRFAYVKTTQSPHYVNPLAQAQRVGAFQAGFTVGNYCYAVAKLGDPVGQADFFLRKSDIRDWHLLPFLDLEESGSEGCTPSQLEQFAVVWGERVASELGVPRLVIYTDLNMLNNRIKQTKRLRKLFMLDLAYWTLGPPPKVPGWDVVFHQYRTNRTVPGFSGPVDEDRCLVPLKSLTISEQRASSRVLPAEISRVNRFRLPQWWKVRR